MTAALATPRTALADPRSTLTRNERFKARGFERFWLSMSLAVAAHFLFLEAFPALSVPDWSRPSPAALEVQPIAKHELPPEPSDIRPPARPVVVEGPVPDLEYTGIERAWEAVPADPPAPVGREDAAPATGFLTPYTLAPAILNPDEVARMLERVYPSTLRDAGIGGTVILQLHVDVDGGILEARVATGSGHVSLDAAALRVSEVMRLSPALNFDRRVAVWIQLPVQFEVRR
jgi:TonB family protein